MKSSFSLPPEYESKSDVFDDQDGAWSEYDTLNNVAFARATSSGQAWPRARSGLQLWHDRAGLHPTWTATRKSTWRGCLKIIISVLTAFVAASVCHGIWHPSYSNPPQRYQDLADRIASSTLSARGNVRNEKVFIAANILNEDLIRGPWGESLLELIDLLGDKNVFVSIYENDGGSGTRDALLDLQRRFQCNSSVVTGEHVPLSLFPTIPLPDGGQRVQRLTYLAEIRNRLLRPLDPSFKHYKASGFRHVADTKFDKILFLNDIYFSAVDAVQLLFSTNAQSGEAQYRAACAIDFVQLFKFYDTFVVRDTDGYQLSLQYYPWFTHLGSGASRDDVLAEKDAVRVRSCWGGMAAFNATVFQPDPQHQIPAYSVPLSPIAVGLPGLPVQFRSANETFWESAECCLVFADIEDRYGLPLLDDGSGVFINPYVRTAYSQMTWRWLPFFRRYDRITEYYHWLASHIKSPENNPRRLHEPGQMVDELVWQAHVSSKDRSSRFASRFRQITSKTEDFDTAGHFSLLHRKAEPGGFCGQRRLFVMLDDVQIANTRKKGKNWESLHVLSST